MKNYKDYNKTYIGSSDSAYLMHLSKKVKKFLVKLLRKPQNQRQ